MRNPDDGWINDEEEVPSLTDEFIENVKKHFAEKDAKAMSEDGSSTEKQSESFGGGIVDEIKANHPRLTDQEIEDLLDAFY